MSLSTFLGARARLLFRRCEATGCWKRGDRVLRFTLQGASIDCRYCHDHAPQMKARNPHTIKDVTND